MVAAAARVGHRDAERVVSHVGSIQLERIRRAIDTAEHHRRDESADSRKYSPATCTGMEKIVVWGSPNLDTAKTYQKRKAHDISRQS